MTTRDPVSAYLAYPLQVSANRRYLVDQRGVPFLVHGDTAWSLTTALTREETRQYLADRRGKGFNSLIVNLIEHNPYPGCELAGSPRDRIAQFASILKDAGVETVTRFKLGRQIKAACGQLQAGYGAAK